MGAQGVWRYNARSLRTTRSYPYAGTNRIRFKGSTTVTLTTLSQADATP